ncbi:MAG TPA: hypothetical protein VG675_14050 [Bryobacteraceae bacterium]|nr:hypothetical protein [Bryobacteraceae bacterium]
MLLICFLAACNRGTQSKDAVRQAILDYLAGLKLNLPAMTIDVTTVKFDGNHAEATVSFTPKGGDASQGMSMRYQLEQHGKQWVVVARQDSGHAHGETLPGAANPHEGVDMGGNPSAAAPPAGGTPMPSPEDLPPANGQKK